jgi:hypothetical protein
LREKTRGGEKVAQRGRPRLYASVNEKLKAYRDSKKLGGAVRVGCYLPVEYKDLLGKFCKEMNYTISEAICYFLDLHYGEDLDADNIDGKK